jgi:hypothetical protein
VHFVFFQLHDIKIALTHIQEFGNIFLADDMAPPKRRPFMFAGNDLSNVMGQGQAYGFFYGYDFEHLDELLVIPLINPQ